MRVSASLDGKPDVRFPPVSRVVSAGLGERGEGGEGGLSGRRGAGAANWSPQ